MTFLPKFLLWLKGERGILQPSEEGWTRAASFSAKRRQNLEADYARGFFMPVSPMKDEYVHKPSRNAPLAQNRLQRIGFKFHSISCVDNL